MTLMTKNTEGRWNNPRREMFHDPTETPDTGGSTASANPSMESTPQAQSQPEDESWLYLRKQLTKVQALFQQGL